MSNKQWITPAGKSYNLYADMLSQPHLMIAGKTGSGKSVVVNALIYHALFNAPQDSKKGAELILIDPKRVELARYKNLPHVLRHATEPAEFPQALQLAMSICDARYRDMARRGLLDYDGGEVYVIIDEFADLMTTSKKTCSALVQRIAQVGRAAHVHIILCTQCPLAKIIPTEIKVNFDSVLALKTANVKDSRYIMGAPGCESLPDPRTEHKAHGYYRSSGDFECRNLPMIPADDIAARVAWWTDQAKPKGGLLSRLFG